MKFVAYSLAALLAGSSIAVAASPKADKEIKGCSYKVGSQAVFTSPTEYVEIAKKNRDRLGGEKGEFETTEDYNKRLEAAQKELAIKPVLVENIRQVDEPKDYIKYDADKKRFTVFVGAWIGTLDGIDYRAMDKVVLQSTVTSKDIYVASNAYGQEVPVRRTKSDVVAIKSWKTYPDYIRWKYETNEDYALYVYIPVPAEQAKTFKTGLRTGIEFLPKMPYYSDDKDWIRPKIDSPLDMTYNYQQLDGVVLCAVISDKDGKVVKTIQPVIK